MLACVGTSEDIGGSTRDLPDRAGHPERPLVETGGWGEQDEVRRKPTQRAVQATLRSGDEHGHLVSSEDRCSPQRHHLRIWQRLLLDERDTHGLRIPLRSQLGPQ